MTELQKEFFDRLNRLDNGNRAALRRSAGVQLKDADSKAMTAFYRCLPAPVGIKEEEKWFAVACLRCIWDAGEEGIKPLEKVIAEQTGDENLSASTLHRVEILLDTDWDEDGYMLSKLTRLVILVRQRSDREAIDFAELLDDLIRWNAENQIARRKWARQIFCRNN